MVRRKRGSPGSDVGAIVCLMALAWSATAHGQVTTQYFDTPAVHVRAGGPQDYDVSGLPPLTARDAITVGTNGAGVTIAQAMANTNSRTGFMATTSSRSPDQDNVAPTGDAIVTMDFFAADQVGRERVKVEVDFDAVIVAGAYLPSDASHPYPQTAGGSFFVEVGGYGPRGSITRTSSGAESVYMPTVHPVILKVQGWNSRTNSGDPRGNNSVMVLGNGFEIERKHGVGPLVYGKKIVLDVPANVVQLIKIHASSFGNGFTYVDPVVTPHPDNPDVVVTLRGAVDPDPPPLSLFSFEEFAAADIDIGPLQELGLLPSPPSVAFLIPEPSASYRAGGALRTKFKLTDVNGNPISDADAKSLVAACRVKTGLDTASTCARYSAKRDAFGIGVKVPREAAVGPHPVVVDVLDENGVVVASNTTEVSIRARSRTRTR